jgi:Ca-activated chloride channel homolog
MRRRITCRTLPFAMASAVALLMLNGRLIGQDDVRFRSGVELVNVTATVTDRSGRFVSGLRQSDFTVYEDDRLVDVAYFSAERVPVSLGIVLDTSASMAGDKIAHARGAIERFLDRLLNPEDEVFLSSFSNNVVLVQEWTTSRTAVSAALRRVQAVGGTAMYDAMLEALAIAEGGRNRKKALVLISDGNDTTSNANAQDVQRVVRETEVLVYAVGIDGEGEPTMVPRPPRFPPPAIPFPWPGRSRPRWPDVQFSPAAGGTARVARVDRLNASALRELTDSSGGRTEIVRSSRDLDPATMRIANELSQQYYLGYMSPGHRDGRWHSIRVELRDRSLRVRARAGYLAMS